MSESYDIAPGMADWPTGTVGDGELLLPTALFAVTEPDLCPLAGALPAVASLMNELLAVGVLVEVPMTMGAK